MDQKRGKGPGRVEQKRKGPGRVDQKHGKGQVVDHQKHSNGSGS